MSVQNNFELFACQKARQQGKSKTICTFFIFDLQAHKLLTISSLFFQFLVVSHQIFNCHLLRQHQRRIIGKKLTIRRLFLILDIDFVSKFEFILFYEATSRHFFRLLRLSPPDLAAVRMSVHVTVLVVSCVTTLLGKKTETKVT